MAIWFYVKDNTQHGPVSATDIEGMLTTGEIHQESLIWREGMPSWLPLRSIPEFATSATITTPTSSGNSTSPYAAPYTSAGQPSSSGLVMPTDSLSIVSLVLGILSITSCYVWALFGIPAVICGHMSLKKIKNCQNSISGRGMAITGLVCGYISILVQLAMIIFLIVAFTTGTANGVATFSSPAAYSP